MGKPLRVLTIGHSYTIDTNRSIIRKVADDPSFRVTVAAPEQFVGDLRPVTLDREPAGSRLKVVGLNVRRAQRIHTLTYDDHALKSLIRKGGFDVVHAWEEAYVYPGYQISRALRGSNARFCFRTAQNKVKWYPFPFGHFERQTLARAQGWIAGGNLVYQAMLRRRYPASRGRVIPLAADTESFRPLSMRAVQSTRDELGLEDPLIGFVGRLTKSKGMDVLMSALEQLRNPRWNLLLLGSGPYEAKIRRWAADQGWSDRIRIVLAQHGDVPRYLGAMDLMVAPSQTCRNWKEQFGRMIVEAFACGVPVIASDSGEIPYVVGDAGRIVPEGEPRQWADAIDALIDDIQARRELSQKGLRRVIQYSVDEVAAKYRQYYRWLASQAA